MLANDKPLDAALKKAGDNRPQLQSAIDRVSGDEKTGMEFLIRNMPESDLRELTADFLVENVRLAFQVREKTPWGKNIPIDIFLNDVLPYANVNEARDPWRAEFVERFLPVVSECKTASEAAQKLNETVFNAVQLRYSTKRKRADQSPKESMHSGLASCTGLSIILSDACRAVGVPARLVGIPQWANKPGNHTWIEVWDGKWHFTGAAEPNAKGLNHTWFQGDAAHAKVDSKLSAIYATSFKKTGTTFPLVWAPTVDSVHGVNVTRRYTPDSMENAPARLMVRVWNAARTERVAASVSVSTKDAQPRLGTSRDEGFDTNDLLTFDVVPGASYKVSVKTADGAEIMQSVKVDNRKQFVVDIVLPAIVAR